MSYEEVFSVHKSAKKEDLADRGKQALLNARDLRLKESGGRLWLRIQPIEDLNLEPATISESTSSTPLRQEIELRVGTSSAHTQK